MDSKFNLLGIIALVGAVLMIVGVFLAWVEVSWFGLAGDKWTGWDVFNDGLDGVSYTFVPLLSLICGIIALVLMIVPTFMNVDKYKKINNILGLIALILAIVVVICGLLFYLQSWDVYIGTIHMSDYIQIGFWLTLIGAVITAIGGIMPIVKNRSA